MSDRHECPDCGASHRRRTPTDSTPKRSQASNTDLQPGRCRRCNGVVIRGRVGGLDTTLEPQPLNAIGWQTYVGIGRALYLRRGLRATFVGPQSRWPPPEGRQAFVEHVCHKPIPDPLYSNNVVVTKESDDFSENPPF